MNPDVMNVSSCHYKKKRFRGKKQTNVRQEIVPLSAYMRFKSPPLRYITAWTAQSCRAPDKPSADQDPGFLVCVEGNTFASQICQTRAEKHQFVHENI